MTVETCHFGESEQQRAVGWFESIAAKFIAEYRSEETTLGRMGRKHSGVATRAARLLKLGAPLQRALAESVGLQAGSREAVQASALLVLGGLLELKTRRYPALARSGAVVGFLAWMVDLSHKKSEADDSDSSEKKDEKPIKHGEDFCKTCHGTGLVEDRKGRKSSCVPCKGTGRGNRKFIGDPF